MAPAPSYEFADSSDVKQDLIDRGVGLAAENERLKAERLTLTSIQGIPTTDPSYIALQAQIDANALALDALATEWHTQTGKKPERYITRVTNALYDKTHVDTEPDFNIFEKKTPGATGVAQTPEAQRTRGARTEVVAQTRLNITDLQSQVEAFRGDRESLSHTAQNLLDAGLAPVDLVSTDSAKQEQAINAAFADNPQLARYLIVELSDPHSTNRAAVLSTLGDMRTLLAEAYDDSRKSREAREKIEQATIEGTLTHKMGSAMKALGKDPVALTAFIGALVGLGVVYYTREESTKTKIKSALGWGAAIVGGTYLTDFLWKKMDDRHRGLFDRIGLSPGDLVAPENVADVKAAMIAAHFPDTDQQSTMDFVRVFDMDMPVMNEAFAQSLASGKREIDPRVLQANGLDAEIAKRIDGVSLYKMMEHFYGNLCYKASTDDNPNAPTSTNHDEQMRLGLDYAKSHFTREKLHNAVFILGPHRALIAAGAAASAPGSAPGVSGGVSGGAERPVGIEGIQDEGLAKLIEQHRALQGGMVHSLGNGAYLINGYPYSYTHTEGRSVFVQKLDAMKRIPIDESRDVDAQLSVLLTTTDTDVRPKLLALSGIAGLTADKLVYNPRGSWEILPALKHTVHQGLPGFEPNNTVPIALEYDARHASVKFSAPVEGSAPEYTNVADATIDYEKSLLKPVVTRDVGHLLLDTPFKVQNVDDTVTGQTTLTIVFPDGKTGTLVYKNNAIDTINLATTGSVDLQKTWKTAATTDVSDFLNSPAVQTELDKIASSELATRTPGVWGSITGAFTDLKAGFAHMMEGSLDARYDDEFVKQIHALQFDMRDLLIDKLYAHNSNSHDFEQRREEFGRTYASAISGMVKAKLDPSLVTQTADERTALATLHGTYGVGHAEIRDLTVTIPERDKLQSDADSELEGAWHKALGVHFYTVDATRRVILDKKVSEQVALMNGEIQNLTTPSRGAIVKIVQKYEGAAAAAVGAYYALDTKAIVDKSITDRLTGANKVGWLKPTQVVEDYVLYKMKWENYGVIPKPENAMKIMDLWFEKINNGNAGGVVVTAGMPTVESDYATRHFLATIDTLLGHHQDYSPDRLYGEVYSVSDTDFSANLAGINTILTYDQWKAQGRPMLPSPDALKSADEIYRDKAKQIFTDWFDANLAIGSVATIDGEWPEVFRNNIINTRLPQVLIGAPDAAHLKQDLKRLGEFASVEQSIYVQLRQNNLVVMHGGQTLYQNVLNPAWAQDWNDRFKTALDYSNDIQANLVTSGVMNTSWYVPRIVGDAMALVENTLTDL